MAWNIRQFIHNKLKTVNFSQDLTQVSPWGTSKWSHTDIPRLVKGKLGAQVSIRNWAIKISNLNPIKSLKERKLSSKLMAGMRCCVSVVGVG